MRATLVILVVVLAIAAGCAFNYAARESSLVVEGERLNQDGTNTIRRTDVHLSPK